MPEKAVLILNSRQSKTPVGSDPWVSNTICAVRHAISNDHRVIASIGMNTWELVLWATGEFHGRAIVLYPNTATVETIADNFNLKIEDHEWLPIEVPGKSTSAKAWWDARDRLAFDLAESIVPVSVRPNGRLDSFINSISKPIDRDFRVPCTKRSSTLKIEIPENCRIFENWNYVTHWTCRSSAPWPGETASDFYRAIAQSEDEYPRSAPDTLAHILDENLLRGSSNHIRNKKPAVAFTALAPSEALTFMRWRRRYVRPTFEPYGIAIDRSEAVKHGIHPVTYVKSGYKTLNSLSDFIQGYGAGDWPKEKEWRAIGNVDLNEFPEGSVKVLVPDELQLAKFSRLTDFGIYPLCLSGVYLTHLPSRLYNHPDERLVR